MPVTNIETINLPNFESVNIIEELQLAADLAPGLTGIIVQNPNGVTDGDYVVLNPGEESAELRQVGTGGVSGMTITVSAAVSLQHRNHERMIKLFGSKIRVYRASNVNGLPPDDASFTLYGTVNIDPDQPFSLFTDTSGGKDYWYKFTYYNLDSGDETDIAISQPTRGGGWGDLVSLDDIRKEAGLDNARRLDDTQVAARRSEAQSEVKGALASAGYILPLQTTGGVSYTPPIIENVTRLLSAGLILSQNFGTTKPSSAKDGKAKIDEARKMLEKIQSNKVILLDANDQMLAKPSLVDGWPDETTKDNGRDVGPIMTLEKIF